MKKYILSISLVVVGVVLAVVGIISVKRASDLVFGLGVVTDFSTTLSQSITSSGTTLPLASVADRAGNTITFTSSTFGDAAYFNVEPGTSRSEIVRCTGISGSSFTGCTRGLPFGANGCNNTASTTLQQAHNSGVRVVLSNVCQYYSELVAKDTPQTARAALTVQFGGLILGTGSATTTHQDIRFDADTDFIIRGNRSLGILEYSEDGGVSFSRFGSTSSIADAGRGLLRLSGTGATSSIMNVATGTRSGLEFYNHSGNAVGQANLRVAVSSTSGIFIDDNSSGGLLTVSSTWFIGAPNGLLGFASSSFIIDADNQGAMSALNGIIFETGTSNSGVDKRLFVDPNDGFLLKYQDYPSGANTVTVAGGASTSSTIPRFFAAGQTSQAAEQTSPVNLSVTHNLGAIPAWIKLYATTVGKAKDGAGPPLGGFNEMVTSTFSVGTWVNGASYSLTPGQNSSTYAMTMAVPGTGAGVVQTSTSTLYLRALGNVNHTFAIGRISDVTSSTFTINFPLISNNGMYPIWIQWETGF